MQQTDGLFALISAPLGKPLRTHLTWDEAYDELAERYGAENAGERLWRAGRAVLILDLSVP